MDAASLSISAILPVFPSACLIVYLSICLPVYMSICLSFCQTFLFFFLFLSSHWHTCRLSRRMEDCIVQDKKNQVISRLFLWQERSLGIVPGQRFPSGMKTWSQPISRVRDENSYIDLTSPVLIKAHQSQFKLWNPFSFNSSLETHQFWFRPWNPPVKIQALEPPQFKPLNATSFNKIFKPQQFQVSDEDHRGILPLKFVVTYLENEHRAYDGGN